MHIQEVFNAIYKNHNYEYLIINTDMEVIEFSDRIVDYCDVKLLKSSKVDIYSIVPEFYGLEIHFEELLKQKRTTIEIPQVRKGDEQYVNISVQEGRKNYQQEIETLIVLFENVTEYVLMHQRSIQDRNEKELLLHDVEKKNTKLQMYNEQMEQLVEEETKRIAKFIHDYEKALKFSTLFCRTTTEGVITASSQAFNSLLGYESAELLNSDYHDLIELSQLEIYNEVIVPEIREQVEWYGIVRHQDKAGNILHFQSAYVPIIGVDGIIEEIIIFFVDLTENVKLNNDIIITQQEVIAKMGAIGETRSKETGDHVRRVAEYSKLLALKIGLSIEEAEELKMASPMHDIGKVAIEDAILNKPGRLTSDEFIIMKTHAKIGFEMLSGSNQKLLQTAAILAHEHHEKWDGSGYPRGISGEDIHIFGRITAIADVFDALGHNRAYKKAWPLEEILMLLEKEKGKHFDPELINIFLESIDEFLDIQKKFRQ